MRTIERTHQFKRDFKRVMATLRYRRTIDSLLPRVVELLVNDKPLPPANRDHPLGGVWVGLRECHLRQDLLLVYDKPDPQVLILTRLGSHSELFG